MLTIKAGVVWTNNDIVAHTVTWPTPSPGPRAAKHLLSTRRRLLRRGPGRVSTMSGEPQKTQELGRLLGSRTSYCAHDP
jgi:hypothetical protein